MKVYTEKKNFLALDKEFSSYKDSYITILPVPYESTTSYGKGTALGPAAILDASHYVEFFDEELNCELCFEKRISTLRALDLEKRKGKKAVEYIRKVIQELINDGKYVVTLGGEHTIAIAPIKAHFSFDKDISVLQFDAHSDLRDRYEGKRYSHACFAARIAEFTTNITQLGIRAQCKEEYNFIKEKKINTFYAFEIRDGKYGNNWQQAVIDSLKEKVYVTFDIDYFDPSLMPSTGTPEPSGFFWNETIKFLKTLGQERKVIGFDVVELTPIKGFSSPDYLAAKLIYKMLNYFVK
jgi:agmatinase